MGVSIKKLSGRFLLSSVSILHSSNSFFANRVQLSISAFRGKRKTVCQTVIPINITQWRHNNATHSPNCSCFTLQLKTITPLTTSSTTFHSRVSSKTHWCPRALRAAADILDGQLFDLSQDSKRSRQHAGIRIRENIPWRPCRRKLLCATAPLDSYGPWQSVTRAFVGIVCLGHLGNSQTMGWYRTGNSQVYSWLLYFI